MSFERTSLGGEIKEKFWFEVTEGGMGEILTTCLPLSFFVPSLSLVE
jgi:hypothetical protein